jgi:hypothetical protein
MKKCMRAPGKTCLCVLLLGLGQSRDCETSPGDFHDSGTKVMSP